MLDKILLDDFEEIFNNKKIKWKVLKNNIGESDGI